MDTVEQQSKALIVDLEKAIQKEQVRFDRMSRLLYSTDASNYQMMPIGVTFPRDGDEVAAIHSIAHQYGVPVLPRGGGTGLAGQTVGTAIVMDFSRTMRRVRQINAEQKRVIVESGLVVEHLNRQLNPLNLMYGPAPASADRATVGGCVGNNATGAHSIIYGMTADHVRRVEVVMADGERLWLDASSPRLNSLRATIAQLVRDNQAEIAARYPKTWRSTAGYALNKINPDDVNLAALMSGSEGTLASLVQVEFNLVDKPVMKRLILLHFDSIRASLEATPPILEVNPSAVEMMDKFLLDKTRQNADFRHQLTFVAGDPAAILVVEFYGEDEKELESHTQKLKKLLKKIGYQGAITYATTAQQQANVWNIRKAGLGLLMSERGDAKPVPFVEDAAVPVEHLADYIDGVAKIIQEAGTTFAVYAHASAGCLHVRPLINLKTEHGLRQYREIGEQIADLVLSFQGTITGEHGKGLSRGEFTEKMFGEKLNQAFREVKKAFDPDNQMNPGKIVDVPRMDDASLIRYSPAYRVKVPETRFDWSADYGFNGAIEMCNGAGVCRKEGTGVMCPSYMATQNEAHSTRGRANALRHAISGALPDGIGSETLYEIFDLCLACKACKAECPSSVDMARMKAEFLATYHDKHGIPPTARLIGNLHLLNAAGSLFPALSNGIVSLMQRHFSDIIPMLPTRPLPRLAKQRFSQSPAARTISNPHATLMIDAYTEYYHPEAGLAFMKMADALGLSIHTMRFPAGDSGRPALSKGLLDQVRRMAHQNIRHMANMHHKAPFIFLEPSDLSAFLDDYPTLVDAAFQHEARQVAAQCVSAEAWLLEKVTGAEKDGRPILWRDEKTGDEQIDTDDIEILVHGHCHQKVLWRTDSTIQLLAKIPGARVSEIDAGCCGMAGSFGYEHPELSLKIAHQRLIPAIQARPDALVAAPGFSCRGQIDEAGYRVWHPVELVAGALRE